MKQTILETYNKLNSYTETAKHLGITKQRVWASITSSQIVYYRTWRRKKEKELRLAVLNKYGHKCNRCSLDDYRALQIDHVKGGGTKDSKLNKASYYKRVLHDTKGTYQLLCANCNWIKRFENEEHKPRKLT